MSRIDLFFDNCTIGTLLHRCGIRKVRGASPTDIVRAIFVLPFIGTNFYRGIVLDQRLGFRKDAAYDLLRNPRANWRCFLLLLAAMLCRAVSMLTSEERGKVLVIDDSSYDRQHSRKVELLARLYDHAENRFIKGFRMLTLGWHDGSTFLPVDFAMLSSANSRCRLQGITKVLDRRTTGYRRRCESMTKATDLLTPMIKRALAAGIEADYLLMDSWFAFPSVISELSRHLPVICMLKDMPKVLFRCHNKKLRLSELYRQVPKRPGKAVIKASTIVCCGNGLELKIVFIRHRKKQGWLALASTDINLADEEIIRIYGKRWGIEVFFKAVKHLLNLEREMQVRDYDAVIGHTTVVLCRYLFMSLEQRLMTDSRTAGELFFACCDEIKDLTLMGALQLAFSLLRDKVHALGMAIGDVISQLIDETLGAVMKTLRIGSIFELKNNELSTS
jgi:hypothetical protein